MKILSLLLIFVLASPIISYSQTRKYINKKRNIPVVERYKEARDSIPIYREKLEGDYDILGHVHTQDIFTNKRKEIIKQLRSQALKINADAIMEFSCKQWKKVYQECEGFAIKWKTDSTTSAE